MAADEDKIDTSLIHSRPMVKKDLYVLENVDIGTIIGNVFEEGSNNKVLIRSPFYDEHNPEKYPRKYNMVFDVEEDGSVVTVEEVDREVQDMYFIWITPSIEHTPSVRVKIIVLDENDHAPEWTQAEVKLSIPDTSEPTSIDDDGKIKLGNHYYIGYAVDPDLAVHGHNIQAYKLVSGNDDDTFTLMLDHVYQPERRLCYLQLAKELDSEIKNSYKLVIDAIDGGDPPKKGSITVRINVTNGDPDPNYVVGRSADDESHAPNLLLSSLQLGLIAVASLLWKYIVV